MKKILSILLATAMALSVTVATAEENGTYRLEFESADSIKYETPTTESDGNVLVVWNDDGYAQWNVDIDTSGVYDISIKAGVDGDSCMPVVYVDNRLSLKGTHLENGGNWEQCITQLGDVSLTKGIHIIKVLNPSDNSISEGYTSESMKADYIELKKSTSKFALEFENADEEQSNFYGAPSVMDSSAMIMWNCDSYAVWTADVETSGLYDVYINAGTESDNCKPSLLVDDTERLSDVAITNEGSYDKINSTYWGQVNLKTGTHKFKVFNSGIEGASYSMYADSVVFKRAGSRSVLECEEYDNALGTDDRGWGRGMWPGQYIEWHFDADKGGLYEIKVNAGTTDDTCKAVIRIDGEIVLKGTLNTLNNHDLRIDTILGNTEINSGSHTVRLECAEDSPNFMLADYVSITKVGAQKNYKLEFESSDDAYFTDTGDDPTQLGGTAMAMWNCNSWVLWNVEIEQDGQYEFILNAATATAGCRPELYIDGVCVKKADELDYSSGNYSDIKANKIITIPIKAGKYKIKIFNSGIQGESETMVADSLELKYAGEYEIVPAELGYINAIDYTGYFDNTPGIDNEDYYIQDWKDDVEVTKIGEKYAVAMTANEWLEYIVAAPQTGYYQLTINAGTDTSVIDTAFEITTDEMVRKVIGQSSGWNIMGNDKTVIHLNQGKNTIKIKLNRGSVNFAGFEVSAQSTVSPDMASQICEAVCGDNAISALNIYGTLIGVNINSDTYGAFYPDEVYDAIYQTHLTLSDLLTAYADSLISAITNPRTALYDENGEQIKELQSGNLTVKTNIADMPEGITVIGAIYSGNTLCKAAIGTAANGVCEMKFDNFAYKENKEYSFKIFKWESLNGMRPYKNNTEYIYVSTNGNDAAGGGKNSPLATIEKARDKATELSEKTSNDIVIYIEEGEYFINSPIEINDSNNHKNGGKVTYAGAINGKTVINGGVAVTEWTKYDDNIWKATVDVDDMRQLWVDGKAAQRARTKGTIMTQGWYGEGATGESNDGIILNAADFPQEFGTSDGIEVVYDLLWARQRIAVQAVNDIGGGKLAFVMKPKQYKLLLEKENKDTVPNSLDRDSITDENPQGTYTFDECFVENDFSLLDEPGEYYFDKINKILYYYPIDEKNPDESTCVVGVSEGIFKICGNGAQKCVKNLAIENITMKYGTWLKPNDDGIAVIQGDYIVNAGGTTVFGDAENPKGERTLAQICVKWADNVEIIDNTINNIGSAAIDMSEGVTNSIVGGNKISGTSAGAVIIGDWNHVFQSENPRMCSDIRVINNDISDIAYEYGSMPAISLYYAKDIEVAHNNIKNTAYSGISIGWGWSDQSVAECKNNIIENNLIENCVTELNDGANIYALGTLGNSVIKGNHIIRSNDIENGDYDKPGMRGGIYIDQGTKYLTIEGNVVEKCWRWVNARENVDIDNINIINNYSDTERANTAVGTGGKVENNTVCTGGEWNDAAKTIIRNAGIQY